MKDSIDPSQFSVAQVTRQWAQDGHLQVHFQNEVASTNSWAKSVDSSSPTSTSSAEDVLMEIFLCERQIAGRGRGTNTWVDTGDLGQLFASWRWRTPTSPQPVASCRAGLALYRAALASWPELPWSLKAPNDLFLGDKKIAGLLLESVTQGQNNWLILGLGFNVSSHPDATGATSLIAQSKAPISADAWKEFLDRWLWEATRIAATPQARLQDFECLTLVHALNLHPKTQGIARLTTEGTILYKDGSQKHWQDL